MACASPVGAFEAAWMRFGEFLGRFVSPIVLSAILFGIMTPVAAATRMFGRDELRLKRTTQTTGRFYQRGLELQFDGGPRIWER